MKDLTDNGFQNVVRIQLLIIMVLYHSTPFQLSTVLMHDQKRSQRNAHHQWRPLHTTNLGKMIVYFIKLPFQLHLFIQISLYISNGFCALSNFLPSTAAPSYSTCVASCCTYQHWPFQPCHGAWLKQSWYPEEQTCTSPHPRMPVLYGPMPWHFRDQPQGQQCSLRWLRQSWKFVCSMQLCWRELSWQDRIVPRHDVLGPQCIWCNVQRHLKNW